MDVRLVHIDQEMPIALSAGQNISELLDKDLPPLRIGPSQQLLGFLPRQLASTTACGGGGPRGSSRGSSGGRSVRAQPAPAASGSSAALGRLLLGVGWRPYAGRRRRRLEAPPPSERKGGGRRCGETRAHQDPGRYRRGPNP